MKQIRGAWYNKLNNNYNFGDWRDLKKNDSLIQWIDNENKKDFNVIYWLETIENDIKKNFVEEDKEISEYISIEY